MRIYVLFIATLFIKITVAQKLFDVKLDNCLLKFEMESDETWISYQGNDSLMIQDFLKGLEEKYIERLRGGVQLQIMVDTINQICCVSYTNKTTLSDRRLDIPYRVQQMPGWYRKRGIRPDKNLCALVSIIFEKEKYTVVRTGYNRNTGKQILATATFLKHARDTVIHP